MRNEKVFVIMACITMLPLFGCSIGTSLAPRLAPAPVSAESGPLVVTADILPEDLYKVVVLRKRQLAGSWTQQVLWVNDIYVGDLSAGEICTWEQPVGESAWIDSFWGQRLASEYVLHGTGNQKWELVGGNSPKNIRSLNSEGVRREGWDVEPLAAPGYAATREYTSSSHGVYCFEVGWHGRGGAIPSNEWEILPIGGEDANAVLAAQPRPGKRKNAKEAGTDDLWNAPERHTQWEENWAKLRKGMASDEVNALFPELPVLDPQSVSEWTSKVCVGGVTFDLSSSLDVDWGPAQHFVGLEWPFQPGVPTIVYGLVFEKDVFGSKKQLMRRTVGIEWPANGDLPPLVYGLVFEQGQLVDFKTFRKGLYVPRK